MTLSEKVERTSDADIQRTLRETDADCLVHLAFFGLTEAALKKILRNMSERAKLEFNKDLEEYQKRVGAFELNIDRYCQKA